MNNHAQPIPAVAAEKLTKVFRDFWCRPKVCAVNNISFRVYPGEVFGLLGPNGSGKSTVLKMILGLLNPTRGHLSVFGLSPKNVRLKQRIGYLPEESYLYEYLTSEEILDFYGRLLGLARPERKTHIKQLLAMIGLSHAGNRPVGEFSKGMARRICLAQALLNDPDLIILDEPTSGLDPLGCRQVKDLIGILARRGKTIILSSHLLADVESVCDRVAIMCNGEIVVKGDMRELLEKRESYNLTFSALAPGALEKALATLRRELGLTPGVSHQLLSLEQFFLQVVEKAQKDSRIQTGVAHADKIAEYLSGEAVCGSGDKLE